MNKAAVCLSWVIALAGGLIILGGLSSLQSDTPDGVKVYRYAWWLWSYEVFSLLAALACIFINLPANKVLICSLLGIATALLNPPIDTFLYSAAALPGANGTESRGLAVAAGLIICIIGNFLTIISTAVLPEEKPLAASPPPKGAMV